MKPVIFFLLLLSAAASCKKQGMSGPKETLLSKIWQNDTLTHEFEYSGDRKLMRMKKYLFDQAGGWVLDFTYEYGPEGLLKHKYVANSEGKKTNKYIYETNNAGKVIKVSNMPLTGADSGKVNHWSVFTYSGSNRLIKINGYMDDDVPAGYEVIDYDASGRLISRKQYGEKNGVAKLVYEWEYKGPTNRIHPGIMKAWVEPFEPELYFFAAEAIYFSYYVDGDKKSMNNFSLFGREAGPTAGLWSKQTIAINKSYPIAFPYFDHRYMRYEYVEK